MSTIHLQVASPVTPDNPRGARAAAAVFVALWRLAVGVIRAASTRSQSVAQEAHAVREMALQYQKVDPRFAADLMAAADRHERLHG